MEIYTIKIWNNMLFKGIERDARWIDIKDELPQPFKTVYIKKGNNIIKAYRAFDEETFLDAWYDDDGNMYDESYNLWSYCITDNFWHGI